MSENEGGEGEPLDEPLPLIRLHDFVPVAPEDAGKRCVVDGFPSTAAMRFIGPHSEDAATRCVVQVENPGGEDHVLTEKGLLVRTAKVKVAEDEVVHAGWVTKRGGGHKSWKKRYAVLFGNGFTVFNTSESNLNISNPDSKLW
eukprot:gene15921-6816_t